MTSKKQKIMIEGHKLMYHVDEVSRWLKGELVAPIYVEIGPINSCNHKCIFCGLDFIKSNGKSIDRRVLINTLKDMSKFGVKSIMFCGEGEPLIYPHIVEATKKAKKFGLDVAITTNGVFFTKEKIESMLGHLSWIKFSIDAGKKETYAKIHNCKEGDFLKVLSNLKYAAIYKKNKNLNCKIGAQILLIHDNINEVEELILKVKALGIDYLVLKPYSQHPASINKFVLEIKKYDAKLLNLVKKYTRPDFVIIYRRKTALEIEKYEIDYDKCFGVNFFALIDHLGNVMPCHIFHEKEEFYYGNINEKKFSDIWQSERKRKIINMLYKRGTSKCRKGCRLHYINKYLDSVKNRSIEHINFI